MTQEEVQSKLRHIIADLLDLQDARVNGYNTENIQKAIDLLQEVEVTKTI